MSLVQQFHDPVEWADYCRRQRSEGKSIGFVPTMGALHEGHMSLARRSLQENDISCMSIFVNPTQFNNPGDLDAYPRRLQKDLQIAGEIGVNAVFVPEPGAMYPDDYSYRIEETDIGLIMEGEFRPGHFNGMLTVVMKLLLLTGADRAYFGEKDYQQYVLIQRMAEAFFLKDSIGTEICMCPIIRESDGLAMSSRNVRLSDSGRELAGRFAAVFRSAESAAAAVKQIEELGIEVEYIRDSHELSPNELRRFGAVHIEGVRLIDTVAVQRSGERG